MSVKEPLDILQKYWGYSSFRPNQERIISSILSGKDTLGIMPTGGGKSIAYQVPALAKSGVCLVIEPLISLIKDQIDNLKKVGINAVTVNHLQTQEENFSAINQCLNYRSKFLFVSAEKVSGADFRRALVNIKINLIVIDEAHCISQWGHSFRPSYGRLGELRDIFPDVPVLALTASATDNVKKDIVKVLRFSTVHPNILTSSFFRSNIHLKFTETSDKVEKIAITADYLGGSGIVYCSRRIDTILIAKELKERFNINAKPYHAHLSAYERSDTQNSWLRNETRIIVATTAFGMGIDKPDVRFVIHSDIPSSIERYYQEFGRAGRDGLQAYSLVLYNRKDLIIQQTITENAYPEKKVVSNIYTMICNKERIATGAGQGTYIPLDFNDLVMKSGQSNTAVYNSLKILENEGWISLENNQKVSSRIKILVENSELNAFLRQYEQYYYIMHYVLRLYPTIHHDFVDINEKLLADNGMVSEKQVVKDLTMLMKYNIIRYEHRDKGDGIILLRDRAYSDRDLFTHEYYTLPKQTTIERGKKMRELLLLKDCRWQYILNYFGEQGQDCHICDNCKKSSSK